jgi:hypothetical protein
MFLDPTTAGALTTTEPSTSGQVSKPIAVIITSGAVMIINIMRGIILP